MWVVVDHYLFCQVLKLVLTTDLHIIQIIDPNSEDSNLDPANNGKSGSASVTASETNVDENSTTSFTEDSMDKPLTPASSGTAPLEPESASNGVGGEETNDSIATSDSATNDSAVVETPNAAALSQESVTEEEESRSSLNENVTGGVTVDSAEKRKLDDSEVQVAKKAKTEEDEDVQPETNAEVAEDGK